MPLTPPPSKPQRGDRKTFAKMVDAFIAWLINFVTELNTYIASLNSLAAGGAYALPYLLDPSVTMARPGGKYLRFNAATQNTATFLALDLIGGDLKDYTSTLSSFGRSTSSVIGTLRLVKQGDVTKFLTFNVTAVTTPGSWKQLAVTCIESSSASPFASGDALILQWQPNGDKGDRGMNSGFTPYPVVASDIDLSKGDGYFTKTVAGNTTFTISNCPAGGFSFTLEIAHTAGSIAFPASAKMIGNIAPALVTGKTHLFMFVTSNGGARWRVTSLANFDN